MKINKSTNLSLDQFINWALYDKEIGYYMKQNPFGKEGDFITAPNITRLFSEIITIWLITFLKSLDSPKKFNLIELGAGNGEMMKVICETLKNFPEHFKCCNFIIHEKSPILIKIQKKKLNKSKVTWLSEISKIKKNPSIFIANEFFDSMAIKQFRKKGNEWYEKFVNIKNKSNISFFEKKTEIKKFETKLDFKIFQNQNFVEYSEIGLKYLKNVSKIIKKYTGGLLIIDYGFEHEKMEDTLQAVSNHKFANILSDIGNVDITHNINFEIFKKFIKKLGGLETEITTQRKFLIKMGIKERAEIISKNFNFTKKADIFYRLKRLIDEKEMGNIFKVMFIKNKTNKFKLGF